MGRTGWVVAAAVVCLLALGSLHTKAGMVVAQEGADRPGNGPRTAATPATPQADAARRESPGAAPFSEGVVLADSQIGLDKGPGATQFNFARLRDLWVRVNLAGMPPSVQLDLSLIDPQGTLIYEASVPFSSDPAMKTKDVPGAGHPVTVFQARPLRGGVALDYALPVSGSVVTRYLSAGTWKIVAEVGGRTFSTALDVSTVY